MTKKLLAARSRFFRFTGLSVALSAMMLGAVACSLGNAAPTPFATRAATQTPWIIYIPITSTPEPATVTPLPTVTSAVKTPTRAPTRPPAVAKATVAPPKPTSAPPPPAAVAPTATTALACSAAAVTLTGPGPSDQRATKEKGPGSDTFKFIWSPFQQGETDEHMGYRIDIESKTNNNTHVNGDVVYVQHNWFVNNGQFYVYTADKIFGLAVPAGGENVTVIWSVTVVKTTGGFDNKGSVTGNVINCSKASDPLTIPLIVIGQS